MLLYLVMRNNQLTSASAQIEKDAYIFIILKIALCIPNAIYLFKFLYFFNVGVSEVTQELNNTVGLHHLTGIKLLIKSGNSSEIASNIEVSHSHNNTVFLDIPRNLVS